jgi:heavy metal sensor kinase
MIIKTQRMRLALIFTVCFALLFMLSILAVYTEYKHRLYESIDWTLIRASKTMADGKIDANHLDRDQEIIARVGDDFHQIIQRNGPSVVGSLSGIVQRWPISREKLQAAFNGKPAYDTVRYKGEKFRLIYYPVGKDQVLRSGATLEDIERHLADLKRLAILFPAFVIGISFLMSWLLAGLAVAPSVKLRKRAEEAMTDNSIEKIDIGAQGREIEGLVRIFNSLLEGIRNSIEAHRRFTSDVAHEMRSPLTSLIGNTEVALRKKRTAEEYEELLRNNLADMVRLSRITDNILFLTKVDNKILELRKQRFDLDQFLETIVERSQFKADRSGVILTAQYEQRNLELYGDMNLLEQAFSNLIDNALKYTSRGGSVTVRSSKEDSKIQVAIIDTGIGIPEDEIPHIFNRFYRVEREQTRAAGTGLGLSITQWIIHANDGEIFVKSKVGAGSEFIVVFPTEEHRRDRREFHNLEVFQ